MFLILCLMNGLQSLSLVGNSEINTNCSFIIRLHRFYMKHVIVTTAPGVWELPNIISPLKLLGVVYINPTWALKLNKPSEKFKSGKGVYGRAGKHSHKSIL